MEEQVLWHKFAINTVCPTSRNSHLTEMIRNLREKICHLRERSLIQGRRFVT